MAEIALLYTIILYYYSIELLLARRDGGGVNCIFFNFTFLLYLIVLFSARQGGVNCNILSNSGGGVTSRKDGVKQLFYHPEFYPLTALVND